MSNFAGKPASKTLQNGASYKASDEVPSSETFFKVHGCAIRVPAILHRGSPVRIRAQAEILPTDLFAPVASR
jgi:hypothetical protein